MRNFLQDWVINKLNGYYLMLYANDKKIMAGCLAFINYSIVSIMVVLKLIPPRIKSRRD